jgi:hypothetical protein
MSGFVSIRGYAVPFLQVADYGGLQRVRPSWRFRCHAGFSFALRVPEFRRS